MPRRTSNGGLRSGAPVHRRADPGQAAQRDSIAQLLGQLFQITEAFEMETQPQLLLLQKTMLMAEGLTRRLRQTRTCGSFTRPLIERWARENLGVQAACGTWRRSFWKPQAACRASPRAPSRYWTGWRQGSRFRPSRWRQWAAPTRRQYAAHPAQRDRRAARGSSGRPAPVERVRLLWTRDRPRLRPAAYAAPRGAPAAGRLPERKVPRAFPRIAVTLLGPRRP